MQDMPRAMKAEADIALLSFVPGIYVYDIR